MWSGLQPLCRALLGVDFDDADCERVSVLLRGRPRAERIQFAAFVQLVQYSTFFRFTRFSRLGRARQEAIVAGLFRRAPEPIRRGLAALKSLAALAHYGNQKSWARVGY